MQALDPLDKQGKVHWCKRGGFSSPNGRLYEEDPDLVVIRRSDLDHQLLTQAVEQGAIFKPHHHVQEINWHSETRSWSIHCLTPEGPAVYYSTLVIAADGAMAKLSHQVGLFGLSKTGFGRPGGGSTPSPGGRDSKPVLPNGYCTAQYLPREMHCFPSDSMVFFRPRAFCSLFKHSDGGVSFCVAPPPPHRTSPKGIRALHQSMYRDACVGQFLRVPADTQDAPPIHVAPIRGGGVSASVTEHFLAIGDAAGHVDPIFGEGIYYALAGAKMAARVVADAYLAYWFPKGGNKGDELSSSSSSPNLSAHTLSRYHRTWKAEFGNDFRTVQHLWCTHIRRHPCILNFCIALCQREQRRHIRYYTPKLLIRPYDPYALPREFHPPSFQPTFSRLVLSGESPREVLRPRVFVDAACVGAELVSRRWPLRCAVVIGLVVWMLLRWVVRLLR